MKIGIMLRTLEEKGGIGVYSETDDWTGSALRLSLAATPTPEEIDAVLVRSPEIVRRVQALTAALRGAPT